MNPLTISSIINTTTCIIFAVLIFSYHQNRKEIILFGILSILGVLWGLGVLIASLAKDINTAYLGWQIAFIGTILAPAVHHHFVLSYIRLDHRKQLIAIYCITVALLIIHIWSRELILGDLKFVFGQFYYLDWQPRKSIFYLGLYVGLYGALLLYSFILLINHYRTCLQERKKQLRYIIVGSICIWIGAHGDFPLVFGINLYPYSNFMFSLFPLIVGYGILRHRALDIQVAIKKGVAYSFLLLCLAILYITLVLTMEKVFQSLWGYNSASISIITAFTIGIAFFPLHTRIQNIVDRFIFKKTTEEIVDENDLLRQEIIKSEKMKGVATLASGMAHEVKNPLTAIKTFSEYLPQRLDDKEFLTKFSRIVGGEVDRIDALVNQLLEFAKPSPVQLRLTNVNKLIKDTLDFLSSRFIQHSITLKMDLAEAADAPIPVDPNKVRQALLNIFINAIDAMPQGGVLSISTSAPNHAPGTAAQHDIRHAQNLTITVQDTGCGIPQKDLNKIFDPFHTTKDNGTGLGLPITFSIIKEHGGKITVESEVGKGTTFSLQFPASS